MLLCVELYTVRYVFSFAYTVYEQACWTAVPCLVSSIRNFFDRTFSLLPFPANLNVMAVLLNRLASILLPGRCRSFFLPCVVTIIM